MKTKENRKGGATLMMLAVSAIVTLLMNPLYAKAANAGGRDTSKKVYNITTFGNLSTADPSIYVLNGKKVSKAEFDKVDIKDVINVSWVSAENAAKVVNNFTGSSSVLFVTTKNSDEGKKILAKINNLPHNHAFITREGRDAVYISYNAKANGLIKLDSAGDYTVMNVEPGTSVGKGSSGVITVGGRKSNGYATNITSSGRPYVLADGDPGNEVVALVDGKPVTGPAISHLNEKLIIIDDKVATADDLKKLSAFDIEKINYKNDDYTRHQYGDKAKKGVVYIYTKKAKQ